MTPRALAPTAFPQSQLGMRTGRAGHRWRRLE